MLTSHYLSRRSFLSDLDFRLKIVPKSLAALPNRYENSRDKLKGRKKENEMARGKKVNDDVQSGTLGLTPFETRLTNLLALLLVRALPQGEQVVQLSRAGYRPIEIA